MNPARAASLLGLCVIAAAGCRDTKASDYWLGSPSPLPFCTGALRVTDVAPLDAGFFAPDRPQAFSHGEAMALTRSDVENVEVRHFDPKTNRWTTHRIENRMRGVSPWVHVQRAAGWLMVRGEDTTALINLETGERRDVEGGVGRYDAHLAAVGDDLLLLRRRPVDDSPDWVRTIDTRAPKREAEGRGPFVLPYEYVGYTSNGHFAVAIGGVEPDTSIYSTPKATAKPKTKSPHAALFDVKTGAWRRLPDAPFPVNTPRLFPFARNRVLVFDTSESQGAVLDTERATWKRIATPPLSTVAHVEHLGAGHVLAFEGNTPRRHALYDPTRDSWRPVDLREVGERGYLYVAPLPASGSALLLNGTTLSVSKDMLMIDLESGDTCRPRFVNDAQWEGRAVTVVPHDRGVYLVGQDQTPVFSPPPCPVGAPCALFEPPPPGPFGGRVVNVLSGAPRPD